SAVGNPPRSYRTTATFTRARNGNDATSRAHAVRRVARSSHAFHGLTPRAASAATGPPANRSHWFSALESSRSRGTRDLTGCPAAGQERSGGAWYSSRRGGMGSSGFATVI